ncbi:MAG: hypothetical protein KGJ86_02840 [Chloroflexota bacterium]|nr:hypothetical protein [Chloroflexota bacterium]
MNSSMVNKIVKAKQYAQEPSRVTFRSFDVEFAGDNGTHRVSFEKDAWACTCDFFSAWRICCHTMALERLLDQMVKAKQALPEVAAATA